MKKGFLNFPRLSPSPYRLNRGSIRSIFQHVVAIVVALSLSSSVSGDPIRGEVPQTVADVFHPEVEGVSVKTWVQNLQIPWSLVFLPNGDALVSERRGQIQRIPRGESQPQLYIKLDEVAHVADAGLMGLALHPQFTQHPYIYAMHTYQKDEQLVNRVIRLLHHGDTGALESVILDNIPGHNIHIGGRIGFGPDGMLYIGTGDLWNQPLSQDLHSWAGKILRITPEGQIPEDNPFPGSPIFTYGHRVVQGLAWDPETDVMFNSEHGPSGEWPGVIHRDEINIVEKGANYGWPNVVGAPRIAEYRDPIAMWKKASVPPAGMTFYRGDLFVATLRSQALIRIQFEDDNEDYKVTNIERWFARDPKNGIYGRLRDVTVGPDGHLYVLTSNTDGRAELRPNDDKILRLKFETPE